MFFIIKGGFDILRNQIVNIVLQKNNIWNFGMIIYNEQQLFNINSNEENKIELIKYNTNHALVINDMIIYENEKKFMYDINLHININETKYNENKYNENNIYNKIIYDLNKYNDISKLTLMRNIN